VFLWFRTVSSAAVACKRGALTLEFSGERNIGRLRSGSFTQTLVGARIEGESSTMYRTTRTRF
jgi:hypothetical protein